MKILLVEDDRKVAGFIEQGLREEGYVVDLARDGEEATTMAHVNDYDAILLDVVLPKKNGFQIAAELRREGRTAPILMLTSRDATEDVVRGLDAGADDYLSKPFQFDELVARIRALLRRGGAERLEVLRYGPISLDRLRHVCTSDEVVEVRLVAVRDHLDDVSTVLEIRHAHDAGGVRVSRLDRVIDRDGGAANRESVTGPM